MLDHFRESFWIVPFSVFIAGLIGSPHCIAMCGPLVLNFSKSNSALIHYQLGRMFAYTTAGALVGHFGGSLLDPEQSTWISGFSLISIALLLLFNGYRTLQNRPLHFRLPPFIGRLNMKIWKILRLPQVPSSVAALLAGGLTVLLPCGHLYSFLVGSIATGSATKGAVFMFAFWLGSTPVLSVGSTWARQLINPSTIHKRRWAGSLLIAAGLFSIMTFGARTYENYQAKQSALRGTIEFVAPRCH